MVKGHGRRGVLELRRDYVSGWHISDVGTPLRRARGNNGIMSLSYEIRTITEAVETPAIEAPRALPKSITDVLVCIRDNIYVFQGVSDSGRVCVTSLSVTLGQPVSAVVVLTEKEAEKCFRHLTKLAMEWYLIPEENVRVILEPPD